MKKSLRKLTKSGDGKKEGVSESYNYRMFLMFKRKFKISDVEPPQDVKDVFSRFSRGSDSMSPDQFRNFLLEFQGDECRSVSEAEHVVERVLARRHKEQDDSGSSGSLSLDDFFAYLFFDDLNAPIKMQVHHDMTAPLQHYYIFTGHNSYLTGNQLSSVCSDIPIINALQRGVRAIELDLWPSSSKDDVEVLHGRTLTSPVPLSRCLKSIKEHAFDSSPYPVIITLEDHLTPDLQAKVAEMVTDIFGAMLFYPESDCLKDFPSPDELKKRIILSTKPPKEYIDSDKSKGTKGQSPTGKDSSEDEEETLSELLGYSGSSGGEVKDVPDLVTQNEEMNHPGLLKAPNADSDKEVELIISPVIKNKCQQLEVPHYKSLNGIQAGKPTNSLKETLQVVPDSVKRLSLSENALEKAATSHGTDLVRFTQKNVLRIYPKGSRVTSSNYNPVIGWMHGSQMVAFNMQVRLCF
uniref:Phosphoinositide phospholipase C n=1 Tax=Kalanchoe fedtschenkoi TaxID=63787 RepID=A0A7N0THN2_KALFE